jgi:pimeloyl-ACP methyl ester carboxylesterase
VSRTRSRAAEYAIFAKDRRVTVSDGTTIAYTVVGAGGDRTAVVFVNGWTCPDAYWVGIGPRIVDAGHPAVFVDTRGHGQSGLPRPPGFAARNLRDDDVAVDRLARDLTEVLDDAGIERAAFVGHSMGVQLIFELLRVAPERVAALVPVAGTFENPVRSFADLPVLDRIYPVADVLFRLVPFELLRPVMARMDSPEFGLRVVKAIRVAGPKVTADHLAPHVSQIADVNFSVLWRMMSALRLHSTADLLPFTDVPVLVLAGRRDLFTPPSVQQKMADLVPDAEIVWFEDSGHMLPVEEPEGITDALLDFLERRAVTTRTP